MAGSESDEPLADLMAQAAAEELLQEVMIEVQSQLIVEVSKDSRDKMADDMFDGVMAEVIDEICEEVIVMVTDELREKVEWVDGTTSPTKEAMVVDAIDDMPDDACIFDVDQPPPPVLNRKLTL